MISVIDKNEIVNYILAKAREENSSISPKKLQKMLYYMYAWGVVQLNEKSDDIRSELFNSKFEAWVHGPVDPDVYQEFSEYGYRDIALSDVVMPKLNDGVLDLVSQVWRIYSAFSANQLENLTHSEAPWKNARERANVGPLERSDNVIDNRDIFEYYSQLLVQG